MIFLRNVGDISITAAKWGMQGIGCKVKRDTWLTVLLWGFPLTLSGSVAGW